MAIYNKISLYHYSQTSPANLRLNFSIMCLVLLLQAEASGQKCVLLPLPWPPAQLCHVLCLLLWPRGRCLPICLLLPLHLLQTAALPGQPGAEEPALPAEGTTGIECGELESVMWAVGEETVCGVVGVLVWLRSRIVIKIRDLGLARCNVRVCVCVIRKLGAPAGYNFSLSCYY